MSDPTRQPIPPGTLEMLVLQSLARDAELHGFGIAESIEQASGDVLRVEEGSLYPALQRLLVKGAVTGTWGRTDENRRARFYRITRVGRGLLRQEVEAYRQVTVAIGLVLQPA